MGNIRKQLNYIILATLLSLPLYGLGCSSDSVTGPELNVVNPDRITAISPFASALLVFKGDGSEYIEYANGTWSERRPVSNLKLAFSTVGAMGWYNGSAMAVNGDGTLFATFNGSGWTTATDVTTLAGYPMDTIGAIGSFRGQTYFYNAAGDQVSVYAGNSFQAPKPAKRNYTDTVGAMGGDFRGRTVWVDSDGMKFGTELDNPDNRYWPTGSGSVTELDELPPIVAFEIENFYVWRSCDIDGTGEFEYSIEVKPRSWGTTLGYASGSVNAKSETNHWIRRNYRLIKTNGPVDITFWCKEKDPLGNDLFMNGKTATATHTVTSLGTVSGATDGQRFKIKLSALNCQAEAWYVVRIYK